MTILEMSLKAVLRNIRTASIYVEFDEGEFVIPISFGSPVSVAYQTIQPQIAFAGAILKTLEVDRIWIRVMKGSAFSPALSSVMLRSWLSTTYGDEFKILEVHERDERHIAMVLG